MDVSDDVTADALALLGLQRGVAAAAVTPPAPPATAPAPAAAAAAAAGTAGPTLAPQTPARSTPAKPNGQTPASRKKARRSSTPARASPQTPRAKTPGSARSSTKKRKRGSRVDLQPDRPRPRHVMTLFDKDLDLSHLTPNTSLYGACRIWMANNPGPANDPRARPRPLPFVSALPAPTAPPPACPRPSVSAEERAVRLQALETELAKNPEVIPRAGVLAPDSPHKIALVAAWRTDTARRNKERNVYNQRRFGQTLRLIESDEVSRRVPRAMLPVPMMHQYAPYMQGPGPAAPAAAHPQPRQQPPPPPPQLPQRPPQPQLQPLPPQAQPPQVHVQLPAPMPTVTPRPQVLATMPPPT